MYRHGFTMLHACASDKVPPPRHCHFVAVFSRRSVVIVMTAAAATMMIVVVQPVKRAHWHSAFHHLKRFVLHPETKATIAAKLNGRRRVLCGFWGYSEQQSISSMQHSLKQPPPPPPPKETNIYIYIYIANS